MTPDPAWEPKVGDVVAVRGTLTKAGDWRIDRFYVAPWLPTEDHAALLRLRDAAQELVDKSWGQGRHDVPPKPPPYHHTVVKTHRVERLRAALAATEHIRP